MIPKWHFCLTDFHFPTISILFFTKYTKFKLHSITEACRINRDERSMLLTGRDSTVVRRGFVGIRSSVETSCNVLHETWDFS